MACIENWMQKAEDNSKNINNLHAQKNRKGSALITQKKNKEKKPVYAIMEAQVHSVRPSSVRVSPVLCVCLGCTLFVSASPEPNPRVSRHMGTSL